MDPESIQAEQVLDAIRDHFITAIDAGAIIFDLKYHGMISDGDLKSVREIKDRTQQNQFLHHCLTLTCTKEALQKMCVIISKVEGNPKMKDFGKEVQRKLAQAVPPTPMSAGNCSTSPAEVASESRFDPISVTEKDCFYHVDIQELDDTFSRVLLKNIFTFVLESSEKSFRDFKDVAEKAIRHSKHGHVPASEVQLSGNRREFLEEIQGHKKYIALWENYLEYRPLRETIIGCEDEVLMKHLQQYENLLRAKGETIIYNCKKEQERNIDLYLMLKAKHDTTLATLMRVQEFLVIDVGLDDAIFAGFREGCIELYFRLSPETASISMDPLRLDANRSNLLKLGFSKVELSGTWVIDVASGSVKYLMVSKPRVIVPIHPLLFSSKSKISL